MSGTRGWTFLALVVGGLCLGCEQQGGRTAEPSAGEREGRSDVLRGLMAAKEQPADNEVVGDKSAEEPSAITPGPPEQDDSGRPGPTGSVQGRVAWIGDNELLLREPGGAERDLEVTTGTRVLRQGEPVDLRTMEEGDEVRVSYDEGRGGWVARQVEVLPRREAAPRPGQGDDSGRGGKAAPPR